MTTPFIPNLSIPPSRRPGLRGLCAGMLLCAAAAQADAYDGQIAWHNDVLQHAFVVHETSDLVAWTDSYLDGANIDPILAVWHDGVLFAQVDDNPYIAAGQTMFDAGLQLYGLAPGNYLFTLAAYDNFANDAGLASGFRFDGQVPIPLAQWCQPYNNCDMGGQVTLHWTLAPAVPEPSAWALLMAGGVLIGAVLRRRRAARASHSSLIRWRPRRSTS